MRGPRAPSAIGMAVTILCSLCLADVFQPPPGSNAPASMFVEITEGKDRIAVGDRLTVRSHVKTLPEHGLWNVDLTNRSDKQLWLTVALKWDIDHEKDFTFWNGYYPLKESSLPTKRTRLSGTFPLTLVYNANGCKGVGITPLQIFSHIEPSIEKVADDRVRLSFGVRCVVDPAGSERVEFVYLNGKGCRSYRSAVARYQAIFAEAFCPREHIDQRLLHGTATEGIATNVRYSPEETRRWFATWQWFYAPFKHAPDFYGKQPFWDYPIPGDAKVSDVMLQPPEHFHEVRREQVENADKRHDVDVMFYVINWSDERIAKDHYADAIIDDPDTQNVIGPPWVKSYSRDVRVFPWGNKLAEDCVGDFRRIWSELAVGGFAIDCASCGPKYRGPATAKSPGRAWDENGVYCDQSVAIAKWIDVMHSLPARNGRIPGVIINSFEPPYFLACRADASIMEKAPYLLLKSKALEADRLLFGTKPCIIYRHDTLDRTASYLNADELTPEQIRDVYDRLCGLIVLTCLRWGTLPLPSWCRGWERVARALPVLVELNRLGWQAEPAAEISDARLWAARYGRNKESALVVINPTPKAIAAEVTPAGGLPRFRVNLPAFGFHVQRFFKPKRLELLCADPNAVLGFPYEKAALLIDKPDSADEKFQAERLREYFKFYYAKAVVPPKKVELVIKTVDEFAADSPAVRLTTIAGEPKISVQTAKGQPMMTISSPAERWQGAMDVLLRHLDQRYPYLGKTGTMGWKPQEETKRMRERAGLLNGVLRSDEPPVGPPPPLIETIQISKPEGGKPFGVDEHTLFLAHFDDTINADYAKGMPYADGDALLTLNNGGRFGEAVIITSDVMPRSHGLLPFSTGLTYEIESNLKADEGTIEMWLCPFFPHRSERTFYLFRPWHFAIGAKHGSTLVIFERPDPAAVRSLQFFHKRDGKETHISADIRAWKPGEWHHVACTWNDREGCLFIDGRLAGKMEGKGGLGPLGERIAIGTTIWGGGNFEGLIDELRISDVVRYE